MAGKQTTTTPFTTADIERAGIIVTEIAELATALQGLAISAIDNGAENYNESAALAARSLSEKVGWLADLAASKLGAARYRGAAEEWMLPPSYHATEARNEEATAARLERRVDLEAVRDEIDRLATSDPGALERLLEEFDRKVH